MYHVDRATQWHPLLQDRQWVREVFADRTATVYDVLELPEGQIMGVLIFHARHNASVYDPDVISEIRDVIADVKTNVTIVWKNGTSGEEEIYNYKDLCGKRDGQCVVTGERLLDPQFDAMRHMGNLTFPRVSVCVWWWWWWWW
jgi:hypothetical protein